MIHSSFYVAEEPQSKVLFAREMIINEAASELQVRVEYKVSTRDGTVRLVGK